MSMQKLSARSLSFTRALYSMIQFTSVTLLYSFASSLGDFQVSFPFFRVSVGELTFTVFIH